MAGKTPRGWDFGVGREWGGDGNGEISLRATWDQGERDPITARKVPSKLKGSKREWKRGVKARGLRHNMLFIRACI